jgi:hypothetical protein
MGPSGVENFGAQVRRKGFLGWMKRCWWPEMRNNWWRRPDLEDGGPGRAPETHNSLWHRPELEDGGPGRALEMRSNGWRHRWG